MRKEKELINLLKDNSRQTVSELAKKLGISRATVQHGIEKLENNGIIQRDTPSDLIQIFINNK